MTLAVVDLANRMNQLVVGAHGPSWDWAEQCERAQWYALWAANGVESPIGYGTAKLAYQHSAIASRDMGAAPAGSVSFWAKSNAFHVVTNLGNGLGLNTSPLMAGKGLLEFGRNLRITRLVDYFPDLYLGWSLGDGARPQIDVAAWLPPVAPAPNQPGATWAFNPPSPAVQEAIQLSLKHRGRYAGRVDGAWGPLSIKGIQMTVAKVGYAGQIDGIPGPSTCHFVQVYANRFGGYHGAIDSVLGPNSWAGFAAGVRA